MVIKAPNRVFVPNHQGHPVSVTDVDVLSGLILVYELQVCRPHPRGILHGEAEPGADCEEERALGANKVRGSYLRQMWLYKRYGLITEGRIKPMIRLANVQ